MHEHGATGRGAVSEQNPPHVAVDDHVARSAKLPADAQGADDRTEPSGPVEVAPEVDGTDLFADVQFRCGQPVPADVEVVNFLCVDNAREVFSAGPVDVKHAEVAGCFHRPAVQEVAVDDQRRENIAPGVQAAVEVSAGLIVVVNIAVGEQAPGEVASDNDATEGVAGRDDAPAVCIRAAKNVQRPDRSDRDSAQVGLCRGCRWRAAELHKRTVGADRSTE